ncbi:MAG: hypothetical protein KKD94_05545 [Nanoarchaeota archaeon]|nr:hypothetical protein [Nanoarchaeota archaeon]MBU1988913.1 hypothetical protein [Nanoarchaeota archaeon]
MKINEIQRKERKSVVLTFRITLEQSKWMKEKNISPSLLFNKALQEIKGELNPSKEGDASKRKK